MWLLISMNRIYIKIQFTICAWKLYVILFSKWLTQNHNSADLLRLLSMVCHSSEFGVYVAAGTLRITLKLWTDYIQKAREERSLYSQELSSSSFQHELTNTLHNEPLVHTVSHGWFNERIRESVQLFILCRDTNTCVHVIFDAVGVNIKLNYDYF